MFKTLCQDVLMVGLSKKLLFSSMLLILSKIDWLTHGVVDNLWYLFLIYFTSGCRYITSEEDGFETSLGIKLSLVRMFPVGSLNFSWGSYECPFFVFLLSSLFFSHSAWCCRWIILTFWTLSISTTFGSISRSELFEECLLDYKTGSFVLFY